MLPTVGSPSRQELHDRTMDGTGVASMFGFDARREETMRTVEESATAAMAAEQRSREEQELLAAEAAAAAEAEAAAAAAQQRRRPIAPRTVTTRPGVKLWPPGRSRFSTLTPEELEEQELLAAEHNLWANSRFLPNSSFKRIWGLKPFHCYAVCDCHDCSHPEEDDEYAIKDDVVEYVSREVPPELRPYIGRPRKLQEAEDELEAVRMRSEAYAEEEEEQELERLKLRQQLTQNIRDFKRQGRQHQREERERVRSSRSPPPAVQAQHAAAAEAKRAALQRLQARAAAGGDDLASETSDSATPPPRDLTLLSRGATTAPRPPPPTRVRRAKPVPKQRQPKAVAPPPPAPTVPRRRPAPAPKPKPARTAAAEPQASASKAPRKPRVPTQPQPAARRVAPQPEARPVTSSGPRRVAPKPTPKPTVSDPKPRPAEARPHTAGPPVRRAPSVRSANAASPKSAILNKSAQSRNAATAAMWAGPRSPSSELDVDPGLARKLTRKRRSSRRRRERDVTPELGVEEAVAEEPRPQAAPQPPAREPTMTELLAHVNFEDLIDAQPVEREEPEPAAVEAQPPPQTLREVIHVHCGQPQAAPPRGGCPPPRRGRSRCKPRHKERRAAGIPTPLAGGYRPGFHDSMWGVLCWEEADEEEREEEWVETHGPKRHGPCHSRSSPRTTTGCCTTRVKCTTTTTRRCAPTQASTSARDPKAYRHLPARWTAAMRPAGVVTPPTDTVGDLLTA